MHAAATVAAALALLALSACDRRPAAADPQPSAAAASQHTNREDPVHAWLNDGHPQQGLPRLRLFLGPHELDTELALTAEAIQKGMMWRTNFPETNAMLFAFGRPYQPAFWMKNVPIDIDVAYLDPEGVVLEVHKLERQNTNPVPASSGNVQYALETAVGWFQRNGVGPGVVVRTERGSLAETFLGGRRTR